MKNFTVKKILTFLVLVAICFSSVAVLTSCGKDGKTNSAIKVDVDVMASPNEMAAFNKTNDINRYPDDYEGKTVRIKGSFSRTTLNGGSKKHNFVDVYDGCCSWTWVTFTWSGDLPASGTTVTVIGTVHTAKENGNKFAEITAEKVEF